MRAEKVYVLRVAVDNDYRKDFYFTSALERKLTRSRLQSVPGIRMGMDHFVVVKPATAKRMVVQKLSSPYHVRRTPNEQDPG